MQAQPRQGVGFGALALGFLAGAYLWPITTPHVQALLISHFGMPPEWSFLAGIAWFLVQGRLLGGLFDEGLTLLGTIIRMKLYARLFKIRLQDNEDRDDAT